MAKTDAEHLAELREWRDDILAEMKAPGTVSRYGGLPDSSGSPIAVQRMPARAQLLSELQFVEQQIAELVSAVEDGPYLGSSLGVT